jgi:replicative DNA helicase
MLNGGRRSNPKIVHLDHTADRTPPHSKDAEMAVLGAMMLEKEAGNKVIQILPPDAFYYETHRIIYQAMLSLSERNQPIDIITLNDELRRMDKLADVGGSHYLSELNMRTPTAANVEFHARIIFEKALKRRLISAAMEIIGNCYSESTDAFEEVDHAEQRMFEIAESRNGRSYHSMKRLAIETVEMLETISSRYSEGGGVIGVPTGLVKLDNLTGGFQRSDLVILAARPSMGKCVAWDTPIVDPLTGAMLTAEEFYRRGVKGERNEVLTLASDGRMVRTTPSAYIDDGVKPLFRVRTRLGREVRTTLPHPYLTPRGWRPLAEISVGDRIALPRAIPIFGDRRLPDAEVILLAYLIGDGGLTQDPPRLTTTSDAILRDLTRQAGAIGVTLSPDIRPGEAPSYGLVTPRGQANPLTAKLKEHGLWGKGAADRTIPEAIYTLPKEQVALFLNRLFSTGGSVRISGDYGRVSYRTISRDIARGVQHLLLRFGLNAKLREKQARYNGGIRHAYEIELMEAPEILEFARAIGIHGREEALARLVAHVSPKRAGWTGDTLPVETWEQAIAAKGALSWAEVSRRAGKPSSGARHVGAWAPRRETIRLITSILDDDALHDTADADIFWDEIVAIDYVGDEQVYDLTVPVTHNFVAGDFYLHNTAVAMSMARNAAIDYKKAVAFFSLEMSATQLVMRLISAEAKVDQHRLRTGDLKNEHWQSIVSTIHRLTEAPMYIDDTPALGIMELRARARLMKREHNIELIIIDYLQLMHAPKAESREREISMISRGLKQLAKELDIPIIALSQLNRSVESRGDKRPMLSDLRESGSIEQDADVVMFVHRPEYYGITVDEEGMPTEGTAELIIGKQRNGPTGTAKLAFVKEFARFENLAFQYDNAPQYLPPSNEEAPF